MIPTLVKTSWAQVKDLSFYLVIVLVLIFYIGQQRVKTEDAIRSEINQLGTALCERSKEQDAVGHYNSALNALIKDLDQRRDENVNRGDWNKALINVKTAEALKLAKLPSGQQDCSRPLLPERG